MIIPLALAYIGPGTGVPVSQRSFLDVLLMPVLAVVFVLGLFLLIRHFSRDQEHA